MFLYTKQFDWEKMWAIADDITDEEMIRTKAQDILDTFDIEGGGTIEKVWEMAKYVVAFEQWVKDEQIAFIASHYDGFAQGKAGVLDSMLIPAFSMLIKQGIACAVEGDIKVAMAMSILKTISGTGQLSEMYSIDFNEDICIIGHSGSGDADISDKKPTMKIVPVFHGKTGGGYLTQFYPYLGPVTYLGITQDRDGHFKFVVAEGVNEPGPIFTFGDTNMRTRFSCGAREFCNKWSEAGPTHHMAAATECPVVFPSGVGVVDWMVPGGRDIAVATSELMKQYDVAIWAHHGMFCSGEDFDLTFGLMHTVEKSAEILVKMMSMRPDKLQTITPQNFRDLAVDFKVELPEKFLYEK